MRTILFGSRYITDYKLLCWFLTQMKLDGQISVVLSGHSPAGGADLLGERWAADHGMTVDNGRLELHPADFKSRLGLRAGPVRNKLMASIAEQAVGLWDTRSRGTASMIQEALAVNIPVYLWTCQGYGLVSQFAGGQVFFKEKPS